MYLIYTYMRIHEYSQAEKRLERVNKDLKGRGKAAPQAEIEFSALNKIIVSLCNECVFCVFVREREKEREHVWYVREVS